MVTPRAATALAVGGALGVGAAATAVYMLAPRVLPLGPARWPKALTLGAVGKRIFGPRVANPPVVPAASKGAPQTGLFATEEQYPQVRREDTVETLHGIQVPDPYRWLEDPDSEETKAFVTAQNKLTQAVLEQCGTREQFKELFTKLYDYEKQGTPFKKGDRYYYYYNSGLQQQYVLYSQPALDKPASIFFDPNTLSDDGTVSLRDVEWTEDGTLAAYSLSSGGSDWTKIHVMTIPKGGEGAPVLLPDVLQYTKFSSIGWTLDNKGFFYNRYEPDAKLTEDGADLGTETASNTNQLLCYHVLGTPQSKDVTVWAMPDHPTWMSSAGLTEDGKYLVLYLQEGCLPANRVYVVELAALAKKLDGSVDWAQYDFFKGPRKLPLIKLVDDFNASYGVVANDGPIFYLKTNLNAPRYRVVKADVSKLTPHSSWPDVIPQHPADVLRGVVAVAGDKVVARYLRDVTSVLQLHDLASGALLAVLPLPGLGTVGGVSAERKDMELFFGFNSFVEPGAQYSVDLSGFDVAKPPAPQLLRRTELKVPHDPADYEVKQVFVTSKDGTKVPMFITHRKGLKLDGSAPCLLYGYGGFNVALEPAFSASRLAFIRGYNGIFAQANMRGGGEYGTAWRDAGSTKNKQNVFDDFQACAEYLHAQGYCSPSTTTIQGGSNGGLLVAACANQRPDLYACVLGQVGVMDMLRFHKFTIGHAWITDYGNPDKLEDFEYIFPYSPLHNVRIPQGGSRQYPAIMLLTGDHDDRVVPHHSHKLMATLQYELVKSAAACEAGVLQRNPLIIRVDVRAGHGAGKPTAMLIAEQADMFGFAAKCTGAKWVDSA